MKPRVYLAGYTQETEYREHVKKYWGYHIDAFDPMTDIECDWTNGSPSVEDYFHIVDEEKATIETSDVVVAYIRRFTIGTSMEILHAYNNNIPVLIIAPNEKTERDLWLAYHSTKFFRTIDECFNYIKMNFNQ